MTVEYDAIEIPAAHVAIVTDKYNRHKVSLTRSPLLWGASRIQLQNALNAAAAAMTPPRSALPPEGWEFHVQALKNGEVVEDTGSIYPGVLDEVPLKLLYPVA